jgi:hypothetical protein
MESDEGREKEDETLDEGIAVIEGVTSSTTSEQLKIVIGS